MLMNNYFVQSEHTPTRPFINCYHMNVVKAKVRSGTCYSASYMSQTRDQKRFTILEVAADWHELMIPQCTMRPSVAHIREQLDPRLQLADIPTPQSAILGLHPAARKLLLISHPAEGRRLS